MEEAIFEKNSSLGYSIVEIGNSAFQGCISLKKISVPRSKSPNIIRHIKTRNRNVFKNASDTLTKSIQRKKEIFSINSDFLHCRNCMLIIALNRYGKFYFNK